MLYFILNTNGLKIELTQFKAAFNESNGWFSSEFVKDYSFPFEVPISYLKSIIDFDVNAENQTTLFEGKLYKFGKIEAAKFKVKEVLGLMASCVIFSGDSMFPGFDKMLSEFDLQNLTNVDMKALAKTTIVQDYPNTNFNFPMVHTENYDTTSEEFHGFLKVLNNFDEGDFIENIIEPGTNIDLILNIMQPMPYLMHVLHKIFEYSGHTLAGDVLTIPDLNQALLCNKKDYFTSTSRVTIPFRQKIEEWHSLEPDFNGIAHVKFLYSVTIEKKGNYVLYGQIVNLFYYYIGLSRLSRLEVRITKTSGGVVTTLYHYLLNSTELDSFKVRGKFTRNVDFNFSAESGDIITITKIEPRRDVVPEVLPNYPEAFSLDIFPVRYLNPDGSPIVSLIDKDYVDLKELVPEMTAEEFVNEVRKLKNLDFTVDGSVVTMNFIDKGIDRDKCIDLSEFNIQDPLKLYDDELSFEMFFTDEKKENNNSVYVTKNEVFENNYTVLKTTEKIEMNSLAYPVENKSGLVTAFQNDDESSKLRLVYFSKIGLLDTELPVCYNNDLMRMSKIYENYYKKWLTLRINAIKFSWNFIIPLHKYPDFNVKSIIFYNRIFHVLSEKENELLLINNKQYLSISAKTESFY